MSLNNTDLTAPAVRRIIQVQPDYWVFMLAVELLRPGLAEVQLGYDELKIGLLRRPFQQCDDRTFMAWIEEMLKQLSAHSENLASAVTQNLVTAFGNQVDDVDPRAIQRACVQIVTDCQAMLEWERSLQAATFSADFNAVKQRLAGWTLSYFDEIQRVVRGMEGIYLDPPNSASFTISLRFDAPATTAGFTEALHACLVRRGWA